VEQLGVTLSVEAGAGPAARAAGLGGVAGRFDETGDGQHLAMEVGGVQSFAPDGLVDLAELGDRERLADERGGERRVLELRPGAFQTVGEDAGVVEGEDPGRSRPLGDGSRRARSCRARPCRVGEAERGDRGPLRVGGVAARGGLRQFRGEREVGDRDDPHPGIAAGTAVAAELLKVRGAQPRSRLLGELAGRGLREVLVGRRTVRAVRAVRVVRNGWRAHESAGQRPAPLVRRLAAAHEQRLEHAVADGQRDHVHGHRDGRVGPRVVPGEETLRVVHR